MIAAANALTARGVPVAIHAFTDGRDVAPTSAKVYLEALRAALPMGARIATVSGRYYAMDRDNRWDRVQLAYEALAHGEGTPPTPPPAASTRPMPRAAPTSSSSRACWGITTA